MKVQEPQGNMPAWKASESSSGVLAHNLCILLVPTIQEPTIRSLASRIRKFREELVFSRHASWLQPAL